MVVVGIILLLPGLCAVLYGLGTPGALNFLHPNLQVLQGLLLGCLGLALLWFADRRGRS